MYLGICRYLHENRIWPLLKLALGKIPLLIPKNRQIRYFTFQGKSILPVPSRWVCTRPSSVQIERAVIEVCFLQLTDFRCRTIMTGLFLWYMRSFILVLNQFCKAWEKEVWLRINIYNAEHSSTIITEMIWKHSIAVIIYNFSSSLWAELIQLKHLVAISEHGWHWNSSISRQTTEYETIS